MYILFMYQKELLEYEDFVKDLKTLDESKARK